MAPELNVVQDKLAAACRQAARSWKAAKLGDVGLTYDGTNLWLTVLGSRFAVPATGTWEREVSIPVFGLRTVGKLGRSKENLRLSLQENQLRVQGEAIDLRFDCAVSGATVAADPDLPRAKRIVFGETKIGTIDVAALESWSAMQRRESAIQKALV